MQNNLAEKNILTALIKLMLIGAFAIVMCGLYITLVGVLKGAMKYRDGDSDIQNIRNLGIALLANASVSEDQRYPATSDGKTIASTSTEAFDYLLREREIPTADFVYSPGDSKVKFSGGRLRSMNVGYNYMKASIKNVDGGVSIAADESIPLLWSSGNAPLAVTSGADLILQETGIWNKKGVTVYYKGNSARFLKSNGIDRVLKFVPDKYQGQPEVIYTELAP